MPVLPIGCKFPQWCQGVTFAVDIWLTPSPSLKPPKDPKAFRIKSDLRIIYFMQASAFSFILPHLSIML